MKENYIAIFDSGIGGLTVLDELSSAMPKESFIYIADNKNTPYGNLSNNNLLRLSLKSLSEINGYKVKGIVLGCNTLSVSIRNDLQRFFNCPVFGVFPPMETNVIKNKKTLLLATPKTIQYYPDYKNLVKLSLPNLAKDIEQNAFNLDTINLKRHLPKKFWQNNAFETVILGCTHYCFIKNQILDHFCPKNLDSGNHFTVNFVSRFYKNEKSLGSIYRNRILFLGENASKNQKVYFEVVKKHQKY